MKAVLGFYIGMLLLWVVCFIGWTLNLIDVIHLGISNQTPITTLDVLRIVGVPVAPIGAILGFF